MHSRDRLRRRSRHDMIIMWNKPMLWAMRCCHDTLGATIDSCDTLWLWWWSSSLASPCSWASTTCDSTGRAKQEEDLGRSRPQKSTFKARYKRIPLVRSLLKQSLGPLSQRLEELVVATRPPVGPSGASSCLVSEVRLSVLLGWFLPYSTILRRARDALHFFCALAAKRMAQETEAA